MNLERSLRPRMAAKVAAAAVIGLGLGTVVESGPVALPVVGTTSQYLVGSAGVLVGGLAYSLVPASEGCGCAGDCAC